MFVILATGPQAMPGEEFGDRLEQADRALQVSSEATAVSPAEDEQFKRDSQRTGQLFENGTQGSELSSGRRSLPGNVVQ